MLTVSKPSTDRLNIDVTGVLDADAMGGALDDFIAQAKGITHGQILFRIIDFELPTLGGLMAELQRMPRLLSTIRQFDRCAVLSDIDWLRRAAELEGMVIPTVEIRSFALADIDAAEIWLAKAATEADDPENFPV